MAAAKPLQLLSRAPLVNGELDPWGVTSRLSNASSARASRAAGR